MIKNFQINGIESTSLGNPKITFEIIPNIEIFTKSTNGSRDLFRLGNIYKFTCDLNFLSETQVKTWLNLNGTIVEFKQDTTDTITHEMNCIVEPYKFNNLNFFDSVLIKLESVQPIFVSYSRLASRNPIIANEDNMRKFIKINDNGTIKLLTKG